MYIVGNRSFNSYEQAAQYCESCDFDAETMIQHHDPLRYVVHNEPFEDCEAAEVYCAKLGIPESNIKICRESEVFQVVTEYDKGVCMKALRALRDAGVNIITPLKIKFGKYCKDIYHLQQILKDAGFDTRLDGDALWLNETKCSWFATSYDSKYKPYLRLYV